MMFKKCNVLPLLMVAFMGLFIFSSCKKDLKEMDNLANTEKKTRTSTSTDEHTGSTANTEMDNEECLENCEEFCFDFIYPVTIVFPDSTTAEANDAAELEKIAEDWYDQNPNSDDDISLDYPVEVELEEGEIITIDNDDEFFDLLDSCFDDEGECFEFVYPLTVVLPDGTSIAVDDDEELEEAVENWYDQNPDSDEDPTFAYPIEVLFEGDDEPTAVDSDEELEELIDECYGDDYEECFEINFPVTLLLPGEAAQAVNDYDELYDAVDAWYEANPNSDEDPTLEFPITVTLDDGSEETINNEDELDELFEDCYDDDDGCDFNGANLVMGLQGTAATQAVVKKKKLK